MTPDEPGVRYQEVDGAYFERRGLRRYARVRSLWAMGGGAVISGDFFGWSYGLASPTIRGATCRAG